MEGSSSPDLSLAQVGLAASAALEGQVPSRGSSEQTSSFFEVRVSQDIPVVRDFPGRSWTQSGPKKYSSSELSGSALQNEVSGLLATSVTSLVQVN